MDIYETMGGANRQTPKPNIVGIILALILGLMICGLIDRCVPTPSLPYGDNLSHNVFHKQHNEILSK